MKTDSFGGRATHVAAAVSLFAFVFLFASLSYGQIRQTALYIDNGFGAFTKLTATGAGGTLNLPSSGTLASTNSVWSLTGNSGTTPGTGVGKSFLGTTDNVALEFATDGSIAGWIDAYNTHFNTGLGYGVFSNITPGPGVGASNTLIGYYAGVQLTTGSNNTAIGSNALYSVKTTGANTAVGALAMLNAAEGSANNTALGTGALGDIGTYSNCTALGDNANVTGGGSYTDATAIGYNAAATASYTMQLGDANVTNVMTSGAIDAGGASAVTNAALSIKGTATSGGHIQSQQTTAPTAAAGSSNPTDGALPGLATLAHATDVAGTLTIRENTNGGTAPSLGPQAVVTFNKPYATPPIVIITPVNSTAVQDAGYVYYYLNQSLTTVNGFTVSAYSTPTQGDMVQFNYVVIETQ
ncbi:MAG TPA: hypothetical protein VFH95_12715 [Candidatus Kapabacteria bacterium]|nr:hypothetical protein [Candidatus Kapabacteria bacterium]